MWTPKRIVLLLACMLGFSSFYLGYAYSQVGRIDGLPPLPEAFWRDPVEETLKVPKRKLMLEERLRQAFGNDCPELTRAIRMELRARNMVLAAAQFKILPDGRACLAPLSLALFGRQRDAATEGEATPPRGEVGERKFGAPRPSSGEMGTRKIAAAEGRERSEIVNHRRRKERHQDMQLNINLGLLY